MKCWGTAVATTCLLAGCAFAAAAQTTTAQDRSGAGGVVQVSPGSSNGWLVTSGEAQKFGGEAGFKAPSALRPRAVMPMIEILKPETAEGIKVQAPFAIVVQFTAQADAPIAPTTFKVFYGALKFDITSRVLKLAKVTKAGVSLENAQIPAGKHLITMQVQDEKERLAERELRLDVE